jgi:hypothetical protein
MLATLFEIDDQKKTSCIGVKWTRWWRRKKKSETSEDATEKRRTRQGEGEVVKPKKRLHFKLFGRFSSSIQHGSAKVKDGRVGRATKVKIQKGVRKHSRDR